MQISPVTTGTWVAPSGQLAATRPGTTSETADFAERVGHAFEALVEAQHQARTSAAQWEAGLRTDLAAVMIDQQIASLGFQLALNVRNKAITAYRDIMNMPI